MEDEKKYTTQAEQAAVEDTQAQPEAHADIYTSADFDQAYQKRQDELSTENQAEKVAVVELMDGDPMTDEIDAFLAEIAAEDEVEDATYVPAVVSIEAQNQQKKNRQAGFFARNKSIIATGVICSLLGGIIGGGVASNIWDKDALAAQNIGSGQTYSAIPINQTAPVQLNASENVISPVVAIAEAVTPAVVGITNKVTGRDYFGRMGEWSQGTGSGVIFREDGYIITNYHVVEGATALSVSLDDGRIVDGTIVGVDETTDLAVVKIDADNLTAAVLGDSSQLKVGELAVAIGNPLGEDFARTVTDGIISGLDRTIQASDRTYQVIQTNAQINEGNSGGALVNSKGEVIGINSVKVATGGVEGMGFAIPINEVKPIVQELMDNGYVSRPYMGITGVTLTDQIVQYYRLTPKVSQGVLVYSTVNGSPAQQAGIQPGDVLYKVDNVILESMDQLTEYLSKHKAGERLTFLVDRNGQSLEVRLTLGDQGKVDREKQAQQQSNRSNSSNSNGYTFTIPW